MKNKLRRITVQGQPFVYWFRDGKEFVLNISPEHKKTERVQFVFASNAPDDDPHTFWTFYEIKGLRDRVEHTVCLSKPKSIAEMLSFLLDHKNELFRKGQTNKINGMGLLEDMGYSQMAPVWIGQW